MLPVSVQLCDTALLANASVKKTIDTPASKLVNFLIEGLKVVSFLPASVNGS